MKLYYSETKDIDDYLGIHLFQDHFFSNHSYAWDDYDYIIMFDVYYITEDDNKNLGYIRMLVKDYKNTSLYLKERGSKVEDNIFDISSIMNPYNIISIAIDIDFYGMLNKLFDTNSTRILGLLCDASYYKQMYSNYSKWAGFNSSLMRNSSSSSFIEKGDSISKGSYNVKDKFEIEIDSLDYFEPISFCFDNVNELSKMNINIIVGNNGVGKTTVLTKLIDIVSGIEEREKPWSYFNKVIVVAFSPFESFYTKEQLSKKIDLKNVNNNSSLLKNEKEKERKRKRSNIKDYSYIGFRNENNIFDLNLPKKNIILSLIKIIQYDNKNSWWQDKSRFSILIDTLSLSITFNKLLLKLKDGTDFYLTKDSISGLNTNSIDLKEDVEFYLDEQIVNLSSGQIIYSYMLPAIVSEIEDESLIILDEPELYLHPHIEVGLISMLNYLLEETSSYSIIATHSAVLVREVNSKGIKILKKETEHSTTHIPNIETYGESLELIIGEVFEDNYINKTYQNDLDDFIQDNSLIDEKIALISSQIGDDALAYVLSKKEISEEPVFEED